LAPISFVGVITFGKIRNMKKNMHSVDRWIRVSIALIASVLYISGTITGELGMLILALGGVLLATSFLSFCPLYSIIGISTCSAEKK